MPDPQQDAAFREALLQMLGGAQAPHPPPPIAPVASHPAYDAVLLESLRRRANPKPSSGPLGPSRIGPETNPETRVEMMREAVNEGGGGEYYTRPENVPAFSKLMNEYMNQRLRSPTAIFDAPMGMAFDDVAARMGKPAGAFRTVVEQRPSGELTLAIKDAVAKTVKGKPIEETAGWMDLGSNVVDDHLSVDNVFLHPEYRGKGLGSELYQEALNEAKTRGHRGLASDPIARNPMSERIWKNRPGVTESEGGAHELMSEYLPRQAPPSTVGAAAVPKQPVRPLMDVLREQMPMEPVASHPARSEVMLATRPPDTRGSLAKALAGDVSRSADDRTRRTLATRWPQMDAALTKHGGAVTLPGANRSYATALDRLATDIHANTLANGGSSTYPLTGAVEIPGQSSGFMVGRYSNQSGKTKAIPVAQFTPDHVRAFIEEHADEFAKVPTGDASPSLVGTWVQDLDGVPHVYLDVAQKHPTARGATLAGAYQKQPPGTATRAAPRPGETMGQWEKAQKAIYDLKGEQELPVGNLAEFVASREFRQRLDEMYEAGVPVMKGENWWDLRGTSLENVYGPERLPNVAGFLASTSSAAPPVHNLRAASEYIRRSIKGEPIIQPEFRIPETSVGWREGALGGQQPGDFNRPGTMMPFEKTRAPNLRRVEAGTPEQVQLDKMNDMYHALLGEKRAVIDRRYAKLAEDPSRGIYVSPTKDKVPGGMGTQSVSPYALIENAVRSAAQARGMDLDHYSAYAWEGIGETIKKTGQLYGVKHPAHTIPVASQGFPGIFDNMIAEKAAHWGITVDEMKRRLKSGDAELLMALLSTSVGAAAYSQWRQADPTKNSASPPVPPRR